MSAANALRPPPLSFYSVLEAFPLQSIHSVLAAQLAELCWLRHWTRYPPSVSPAQRAEPPAASSSSTEQREAPGAAFSMVSETSTKPSPIICGVPECATWSTPPSPLLFCGVTLGPVDSATLSVATRLSAFSSAGAMRGAHLIVFCSPSRVPLCLRLPSSPDQITHLIIGCARRRTIGPTPFACGVTG